MDVNSVIKQLESFRDMSPYKGETSVYLGLPNIPYVNIDEIILDCEDEDSATITINNHYLNNVNYADKAITANEAIQVLQKYIEEYDKLSETKYYKYILIYSTGRGYLGYTRPNEDKPEVIFEENKLEHALKHFAWAKKQPKLNALKADLEEIDKQRNQLLEMIKKIEGS